MVILFTPKKYFEINKDREITKQLIQDLLTENSGRVQIVIYQ